MKHLLAMIALLLCAANWHVTGNVDDAARQKIVQRCDEVRSSLVKELTDEAARDMSRPVPVHVTVRNASESGGATSYVMHAHKPTAIRMRVGGALNDLMQNTLPHEVTHEVVAELVGRHVPRWADEGFCCLSESWPSQQRRRRMLVTHLQNRRGIAFDRLFTMTEYPRDVLPLYTHGHAVADFLCQLRGRHHFVRFLQEGTKSQNTVRTWDRAVAAHYPFADLDELQTAWLSWVRAGFPNIREETTDAHRYVSLQST